MVALTYGDTRVGGVAATTKNATATATTVAPRQTWFARFFQALMESRMRQAEREIRMYTRLLPKERYEQAELPFKSADTDTPRGGW